MINRFLKLLIGGERGIRTLDTLPYTHFPGVRLRPLGHLSGLFDAQMQACASTETELIF